VLKEISTEPETEFPEVLALDTELILNIFYAETRFHNILSAPFRFAIRHGAFQRRVFHLVVTGESPAPIVFHGSGNSLASSGFVTDVEVEKCSTSSN
jgi:hypothetical protein